MDEELSLLQAGYLMPLILGIGLLLLAIVILAVCLKTRHCCEEKPASSVTTHESHYEVGTAMPKRYRPPPATFAAGMTSGDHKSSDAAWQPGETPPVTCDTMNSGEPLQLYFDWQQPVGNASTPSAEPYASRSDRGGRVHHATTWPPHQQPTLVYGEEDESASALQDTAVISYTADGRGTQPAIDLQSQLQQAEPLPLPESVFGCSQSTAEHSTTQQSHQKRLLASLRGDRRLDDTVGTMAGSGESGTEANDVLGSADRAPAATMAASSAEARRKTESAGGLRKEGSADRNLGALGPNSRTSARVSLGSRPVSTHVMADLREIERAVAMTTATDVKRVDSTQQRKIDMHEQRHIAPPPSSLPQQASNGPDDAKPVSLLAKEKQAEEEEKPPKPPGDTSEQELDHPKRGELDARSQSAKEPSGQSEDRNLRGADGPEPGDGLAAASASVKNEAKEKGKAKAKEEKANKGKGEEKTDTSKAKRPDRHQSDHAPAVDSVQPRGVRDHSKKTAVDESKKSKHHRSKTESSPQDAEATLQAVGEATITKNLKENSHNKSTTAAPKQSPKKADSGKATSDERPPGGAEEKKRKHVVAKPPPPNGPVIGQLDNSDGAELIATGERLGGTNDDVASGKKKAPADDTNAGRAHHRSDSSKKKTPSATIAATADQTAVNVAPASSKKHSSGRAHGTDGGGRRHR